VITVVVKHHTEAVAAAAANSAELVKHDTNKTIS
jgi:hypothetical protein